MTLKPLTPLTPFAALTAVILSACSRSGTADGDVATDAMPVSEHIAALDSIDALADSVDEVIVDAFDLKNPYKSADEAIEAMRNSGEWDRYEQGVIPTVLKASLDYAGRLIASPYDYFIIADKQSMHVILYDKYGTEIKSYPMACSRYYGTKHKFRDNRTPEGFFSAEGIYDSTEWLYTDDDGYTSPTKGVYGPRFIRLKTGVTRQVGIHGTNSPRSLGKRASHGCMRLHNESISDLVKYAVKGMPIIVNPSARDVAVNKKEGYNVPFIDLGKVKYVPFDPALLEDETETKCDSDSVTASGVLPPETPIEEPEAPASEKPEAPTASPAVDDPDEPQPSMPLD